MSAARYNGSDEMSPEVVLAVCANPTCNRRDSYYGHDITNGNYGKDEATGRNLFKQNTGRGRKAIYCSGACKVDAHTRDKARKQAEQAERDRIAAREQAEREKAYRHEALQRQVERVVSLALTQCLNPNSRPSTTQIKHAAEHATRSLFLADLVRNP